MCGIAGIVTFDGRQVSEAQLRGMTDRMRERGPDDDGFFTEGTVGLGSRRLSIIDVDGGHQPLTNEDESLQLVLNGEIYNHLELRARLLARGHVFRTASDAEVVLHLYEERGTQALAELNGMFAFALYDSRRQALWIARDRLGVKPLFYAAWSGGVAFASNINALGVAFETEVVPKQMLKYLAFGYAPGTETVWRGVAKLAPGHYLWIQGGSAKDVQYWSPDEVEPWRGSTGEALAQLEELLNDAVKLQLRSDVPLGVFLSGGLDSSSIVAVAAGLLDDPVSTFTVDFTGKSSADAMFARTVADKYHTAHVEIPMGPVEALRAVEELLPMMDEPLADSALLPAYWIAKEAYQRGIKVLLNGAGGDEIFGGYRRHWPPRIGSPTWVAETLPKTMRGLVAQAWSWYQPHRGARARDPAFAWAAGVSGVDLYAANRLLDDPQDYSTLVDAVREEFQDLGSSGTEAYTRTRMMLDLRTYLPENVLALTDKATMAVSVEGRLPLLDHRLVEFAVSLPVGINCPGGVAKGLLKDAMSQRLPTELLNRKKEGFNPPDAVWAANGAGVNLREELLDARTPLVDSLINGRALESVLASADQRRLSASMLIGLFMFNRWHRGQLERRHDNVG